MSFPAKALCVALAGCTSVAAPQPSPTSSTSAPRSSASGPTSPGSGSRKGERTGGSTTSTTPSGPEEITLAFGGDVHFQQYLAPLARNPESLASLRPTLGAADLSMVNLETAITDGGSPVPKAYNFRAPASALDALAGAGVDVVSMANNHGVDYGPAGLRDTLAAKESGPIPIAGIGKNAEEAYAPVELTTGGVSVAVLAATQYPDETLAYYSADGDSGGVASSRPPDRDRLVAQVRSATREHDLVVVYLHWGVDYTTCPDELSRQTAKALEQAGADIIVGGHPHRVQGSGWMGDAYVAYSLGNFIWYQSTEPDSRSGVLTLTVDAEAARSGSEGQDGDPLVTDAEWTPMLIGADGIPRTPGPADSQRLLDLWNQARACTGLSPTP